jgi:processive 1,2-diacylglycerol beta-glucosyltransferase
LTAVFKSLIIKSKFQKGFDTLNKIFIIYANSGAGHRRAAEALNCVIKEYFPSADIKLFDALDYMTPTFRKSYPSAYLFAVRHIPKLWGWGYYFLDIRWVDKIARGFRRNTNSIQGKCFMKLLVEEKPDLVLTTHFLPNELISWLKKRGQFQTKLVTCITDYYPHAWWKDSGVDLYITPSRDLIPRLIKMGIAAEKIVTIGIPIDPVFGDQTDRIETRQKLGLKKDLFTVLITSGGFGVGPVRKLVTHIQQITTPLQIVVICGNNAKLQEDLNELTRKSNHSFRIFGFVQNMHELMAASDVMISKAGGLTSAEAMAKGLPLITLRPIPGQESGNCKFLLKYNAALRVKDENQARLAIESLLNDAEKLRSLRENMIRIGHPQAAEEIVTYVKKNFKMN